MRKIKKKYAGEKRNNEMNENCIVNEKEEKDIKEGRTNESHGKEGRKKMKESR